MLGSDDAETLMGYLPPTGWADVATKRDLDQLGQVIRAEMASLESRLETRIESGLARASLETRASLRTLFLGLAGLQMTGAALAVAVARAG
ncbi:MAG: hypothetical protein ACT4PX_09985 [Actinomycetota bacterium]